MDIRIVILQRGWVAVGEFSQSGEECKLEKAAVIRRWGTQKGLGQLASEGPQSNTILDQCPPIRFHALTAIATIDCEVTKWADRL